MNTTTLFALASSALLLGCTGNSSPNGADLSFDEARTYSFDRSISECQIMDVDGDHIPDVVGVYIGAEGVSEIKLGRGNGMLKPSVAGPSDYIDFADLDGDGKLDAFHTESQYGPKYVDTQFGKGDGTFRPGGGGKVRADAIYSQAADVDGDGYVELLSLQTSSVYAASISGAGDIIAESDLFDLPHDALFREVAGDLNGDRRADFIYTTADSMFIVRSTADGSYVTNQIDVGPFEHIGRPSAVDANADGHLDVAFFGSESGRKEQSAVVVILDGTGAQTGLVHTDLGVELSASGFTDINNDGRLDAYVALDGLDMFALGRGDGTFNELMVLDRPFVGTLLFADMNGDHKTDIVACGSDVSIALAK